MDRTQQMLENGFETLTPSEQTEFMDHVQTEIGPPPTETLPSSGSPYSDVVDETEFRHRLEVYKKLGWNKDYYIREIKSYNKDQEKLRGNLNEYRVKVDGIDPNFENIKLWMKEENANGSPPEINDLLGELKKYMTEHGSENLDGLFSPISEREQIDDYATFLILSDHLGKEEDLTKNMPKELKKKYLAYLDKLEEQERPDNIDSFSSIFQTHHDESKTIFGESKLLISDLEDVSSFPINADNYTSIRDIATKISTKNAEYKRDSSQLEEREKAILDGYFKELSDLANKLTELAGKWQQEELKKTTYDAAYSAWNTRKSDLEGEVTRCEGLSDDTDAEMSVKTAAINNAQRILQGHLDKLGRGDLKEPEITLVRTSLSGIITKIGNSKSEIDARVIPATTGTWKDRIKKSLILKSKKEKNTQYRKKLSAYQERSFDILHSISRGSKLEIDMEPYAHGKDFACSDVLTRSENTQMNLRVLDKTGDAVILRQEGTDKIMIVQKSNDGEINMLIFNSPQGYTSGDALKPNFRFSDYADVVGEPMSINIK